MKLKKKKNFMKVKLSLFINKKDQLFLRIIILLFILKKWIQNMRIYNSNICKQKILIKNVKISR